MLGSSYKLEQGYIVTRCGESRFPAYLEYQYAQIHHARQRRGSHGRYGGANCPPGLANRTPACVPPGQARRMFREGQRIPTSYGAFNSYNDIPEQYRGRVPTGYNYIYRDNNVYVVDPQTRLVRSIINLLGL
jgi:hypothetical protein